MKAAIVSHVLPPTWSGQAMVIERLLRGLDPSSYVLIRTTDIQESDAYVSPLLGTMFHLPATFVSRRKLGLRDAFGTARSLVGTLRARTRGIAAIVRREGCDAVVACTGGDLLDIPAGYSAARRAGVRFFPYFFDHWSQQTVSGPRRRWLAERIEPRLLRGAAAVIVPNEVLAEELESRNGVRAVIVRNACEIPATEDVQSAVREPGAPASISYTGAVYAANYDAFRNLVTALTSVRLDATIDIYTAQPADVLARQGISGPVSVHEHRPFAAIPSVHGVADVLFLPLAFETPYPRLIRSSNPAKMGEYLASGRPILVHAPPDTFVAKYFSTHGCGVVVDELDPTLLASAVWRLLEDNDLRVQVSEAARARAVADYDLDLARATFAATVGIPGPGVSLAR